MAEGPRKGQGPFLTALLLTVVTKRTRRGGGEEEDVRGGRE